MLGKVGSLNASAAGAIALYEAARQRGESTGKILP
jgi:tRNA G18 (ribose-2'-O)-methylase SpoU